MTTGNRWKTISQESDYMSSGNRNCFSWHASDAGKEQLTFEDVGS